MRKLKIAILTDSPQIPAWAFDMLLRIREEGYGEIVLNIVNRSPKSSGSASPFLYRLYRVIDRFFFKNRHDAFANKNLNDLPNWAVPELLVQPVQQKFTDTFSAPDLDWIRAQDLDVIIRLGFRILKGDILQLPKFGIWSFHHGDNRLNRGGPPCFWEVMQGEETTGSILQILNEKLDDGKVIYRSWSQTDPLSVQRNANTVFWKSLFFVPREIKNLALMGEEKWQASKEALQDVPGHYTPPLYRPPGNLEMLGLGWRLFIRNTLRKRREKQYPAHWEMACLEFSGHEDWTILKKKPIRLFDNPAPQKSFWADPFPIEHKGDTYLFFEEFDKEKQKGHICCAKLHEGTLTEKAVILEEAWHLSYPFVFQEQNDFYMVPESAEAGKLCVYKSSDFPFSWEKTGVFFEGEAYDPSLWKSGGKFWLFVNQKPHVACSPFDELNLYWSETLENPVWHAHPANPIVSDVRNSRPAGRLFSKGGKTYRPSQDSGLRYGHQVGINEIVRLSETAYEEQIVSTIGPEINPGALGIHTFNVMDNRVFVDFYFRK
ncbi:hypothetical protein P872_14445 [Rhodonellum psychrophilum GCM71 = DSM 17998]|uniref:Glucosamine inositolphosphorylceramide transferase 1 N-terminal domain-containing protein n=2 Tax=Rhodonellum TaxID=336827 RepID=U5BRI7_9BACT|nr:MULTISPECIES: hypothetical protein [Rhodonellum]ERM80134.1 hypothetical protein P872_14445 [Rhodonellum psychrophilum GCM71 = DSM 17998]SDZ55180.1 hypothetical protein SAMN05444412_12323 [Rhodonellum ikkaensis]